MALQEDAYRYAVKNAFLHDGKADASAVVAKLKALHPDKHVANLMPFAIDAVKKVNSMLLSEIQAEYKKFEPEYELKPAEKEDLLPELEWARKQQVITRFAPNPNGPFHLGSARAAILSNEYARRYKGKFLLRFDDTDPKVKKPVENAEQIFLEDLKWLYCEPDEIYFASDRLELYYDYMSRIIEMGNAYVCTCKTEQWRAKIKAKKACSCRDLPADEHVQRFEKMLNNELKEGEAVLRIKTDLYHKDPSVRDWWAARVVDKPEHPRAQDRHVWPSYNFASAVDDHELGTTLIIRGQEHEQNRTKQEFLYKYFNWEYPHCFHFGRIKLQGVILSTSKIKEGIEKGIYTGWDDPRLGTIRAFRRRGFTAEALRQAIMDVGVKSSDTTIEFSKLADLNKKFIAESAERVTFIDEPMIFDVNYAQAMTVQIGSVRLELNAGAQRFVVSKKEAEKLKIGDVVRLREAYNVRITRKDPMQIFAEFIGTARIEGKPVLGWVLNGVDAEIVMPDTSRRIGIASENLLEIEIGTIVYLDKFGFARIDAREAGKITLYFAHE